MAASEQASERVSLLKSMERYMGEGTREIEFEGLKLLSRHLTEWTVRITFEKGLQVTEFSREIRPMSAATLAAAVAAGPETAWDCPPDEPVRGYGRVKTRLCLQKAGPITVRDMVGIAAIDVHLEESDLLP